MNIDQLISIMTDLLKEFKELPYNELPKEKLIETINSHIEMFEITRDKFIQLKELGIDFK